MNEGFPKVEISKFTVLPWTKQLWSKCRLHILFPVVQWIRAQPGGLNVIQGRTVGLYRGGQVSPHPGENSSFPSKLILSESERDLFKRISRRGLAKGSIPRANCMEMSSRPVPPNDTKPQDLQNKIIMRKLIKINGKITKLQKFIGKGDYLKKTKGKNLIYLTKKI